MFFIKPTPKEKTIITIMVSIAFGFLLGFLSMRTKVEDLKFENKFLIYNIEELSEYITFTEDLKRNQSLLEIQPEE